MDCAIRADKVTKTFSLERNRATTYRALQRRLLRRPDHSGTFIALDCVDVEMLKGEKIGVIGDNGSGKTTLLRLVAGLYKPNSGQVYVKGEATLLTGLGIGMMDELSVEENVFLYGTIYGLERKQIKEKLPEIIEWAEVGDFVGSKLKTLSSGMRSRLAFSVTRHIERDIYLLDEVRTAGDKSFKEKCDDVFESYKRSDKTFLVATHDLNFVRTFCTKTLWLHKGQKRAYGESETVVHQYLNQGSMANKAIDSQPS